MLTDEQISPMHNPSEHAPISISTTSENRSELYEPPTEEQSFFSDNLNTESTLLQPQHVQEYSTPTIATKDIELQKLSRELKEAKYKLDWSERNRQSIENKLAISASECHDLRSKLKVSDEITDSFNTVATLLRVKHEEVVEAVVQLKTAHLSRSSFVKWLSTLVSSNRETRAIPAEARLAMYAEVDYPAQVRAAQGETKRANRRIEALASRLSAKKTALEIMQIDTDKVQKLEEAVSTNKDKIKDLEHELGTERLSVSQLEETNAELVFQLESARKKTESTEQTILDRLELARVKSESTEQTLLNRLDTVLQRQLQTSASEGSLQALADHQKKALIDIQKQLTASKNDQSVVQQELEAAKNKIDNLRSAHDAYSYDLRRALGRDYYGTAAILSRVAELSEESAATNLVLRDVEGDTKIAKIEVLRTARENLETTNKELEDLRKDRDGIYKTLDVSSCLGAHLIIGDLKLAQLNLEVLRKTIGEFEDEEALCEVKRLQNKEVELAKMQTALGAVDQESNKARLDAVKAAGKKE